MKKVAKSKVTIDELAMMVARGFENTATKSDMKEVNRKLEDIDYRLSKIESNHERRLEALEDKMAVVKTYFERNLKVKF